MKLAGAIGRIGSGKDTVIQYISKRLSIPILSIGDIAREIARNEGVPETRENLQKITEEYYAKFGKTYFINETVRRIRVLNVDKVAITGIRAPIDAANLRKHFHEDLILICVAATRKIRFERLLRRNEPRDPKTWREFLEQDREEEKIFQIKETSKLANYQITNNETIEKLFQKVDRIVKSSHC